MEHIKIYNVHVDYGTIRRGHIEDAKKFVGADKLGWFNEDLYNTFCINFYDANKFTLEEIQEIYKPYYTMRESEETEWIQEYQSKYGWSSNMVFDLDNPTVSGVLEKVDSSRRCLEIEYADTQSIPDFSGKMHDLDEFMDMDDTSLWTEAEPLKGAVHAATLPEFMWGDVSREFYGYSNGKRDSGVMV